MLVNHKRVLRILREDNLLAVQPRAFVVTTDSDHEFEVYLNLASCMKLTGMNELWVADITYIRLLRRANGHNRPESSPRTSFLSNSWDQSGQKDGQSTRQAVCRRL